MDIFDQAQALESFDRETALARFRVMVECQGPDIIEGIACCYECGDVIPEARLKALPRVGLCRYCQEEHEEAHSRLQC